MWHLCHTYLSPPLNFLYPTCMFHQLIYMHWMNTMVGYCGPFKYQTDYCEKLKSYIETNLAWMQQQMEMEEDSDYWYQVWGILL